MKLEMPYLRSEVNGHLRLFLGLDAKAFHVDAILGDWGVIGIIGNTQVQYAMNQVISATYSEGYYRFYVEGMMER